MRYPSKHIEAAVEAFARLPGIGKKTALRLVLHLLKKPETEVRQFSDTVQQMRESAQFCEQCHNIADDTRCAICRDSYRKQSLICVVENIRDVMAIENTEQYSGTYHVLGGLVSPMEGIGPEDLHIKSLTKRVHQLSEAEIIMALSPTIEGDTTLYYLSKQLNKLPVKITTLARGVAFGGELEYADEVTLARSLTNRLPYESYLVRQPERKEDG